MLDDLDLSRTVPREEYRARRGSLRDRIYDLHRACWEHEVGVLVVFEGVEASGRGDAIRTLTRRMEPRGFTVHAVQDPRSTERSLPWLSRFWGMVPRYGSMGIFDQSWNRTMLIDDVEDPPEEANARRKIGDINSFEKAITDDGYLLVKLYLLISRDEQRRRLTELEEDELTAWRVSADDWRRHERYVDYLDAAGRVLAATETEWAPWTVVVAEDRYACRLDVLTTIADRLERKLAAEGLTIALRDDSA